VARGPRPGGHGSKTRAYTSIGLCRPGSLSRARPQGAEATSSAGISCLRMRSWAGFALGASPSRFFSICNRERRSRIWFTADGPQPRRKEASLPPESGPQTLPSVESSRSEASAGRKAKHLTPGEGKVQRGARQVCPSELLAAVKLGDKGDIIVCRLLQVVREAGMQLEIRWLSRRPVGVGAKGDFCRFHPFLGGPHFL